MSNSYFQFKQFTVHQDRTAMKVTTDACLFGAWVSEKIRSRGEIDRVQELRILDIGTGTGLLALMLAQKNGNAVIDAVELDEGSVAQAKENIAASPWPDRITVIYGNATTFNHSVNFDYIISNPPFYEKELKGKDSKKNIAHHDEGLLLPELLEIIRKNLKPGGFFYLLLPYKRNEEIRDLLFKNECDIPDLVLVRQSVKHDYFRIILAGKIRTGEAVETNLNEIAIKDENDGYTPEFIELLKSYYLKL